MALKGDLDSLDLGQVFQMLAINHKDGVLGVFTNGRPRALRFTPRGVTLQFDPVKYEERVLQKLDRQGVLSSEQLRLVEANRRSSGRTTLEVLEEMGFLPRSVVEEEYRMFMEESIYEIFFLKNARFEFFEGRYLLEEAGGVIDEGICLNCDSVVMEAARRIDEWELIRERIPDTSDVYVKAGDEAPPELLDSIDSRTVYQLTDGWRSVAQVIEDSGRSEFEMIKACMSLLDSGVLIPLDRRQYASTGVNALAEGRCAEAANLFEKAASNGFGLPEVLGAAGRAREENSDFAVAAKRYREYALTLSEEGRSSESARALLDAAELIPTDLWTRKELVSIGLEAPEVARSAEFNPISLGKELYHNFSDAGDTDSAREVLEWLIEADPDDIELRRALIACVQASGDQRALIEIFEQTAEYLISTKEPTKAVSYLQKIVMIDRSRLDVKERIKHLYKVDERRRNRRRGTMMLLSCAALLTLIGGGYGFYEYRASTLLETIDVEGLLVKKDYVAASDALKAFSASYPLSLSSFEARDLLAKVDGAQRTDKARKQLDKDRERKLRERQIKKALECWGDARSSADRGQLVESLKLMEDALEVAPDDWEEHDNLVAEVADLRTYLGDAERYVEQAAEFERDGKLDRARLLYRRVLDVYKKAPVCQGLKLPFRIETEPPMARIEVGGELLSERTPVVTSIAPDQTLEIRITRRGFEPLTVKVEGASAVDSVHRLQRKPSPSVGLVSRAVTSPVVEREVAYVGLAGGKLVGIRLLDGEKTFSYTLPDLGELCAAPAIDGGTVYLGDSNGRCVAIQGNGRIERWVRKLEGSVRSTPLLTEALVLFALLSGNVVALDRSTGELSFNIDLESEVATSPILVGDSVLIGTAGHELLVLDIEGQGVRRRYKLQGAPLELLPMSASRVLAFLDTGGLVAIDLESENPVLWEKPGSGPTLARPLVVGDYVYFGLQKELLEIDARSGVTLRRYATGHYLVGPPACIDDAWLYFATQEGQLVALRRKELEVAWKWGEDTKISFLQTTDSKLLVAEWQSSRTAELQVFDTADEWQD